MLTRVLFGLVLIAALVGLLMLDGWVDGLALHESLSWMRRLGAGETFPPGTVVLPVMIGVAILAVRELTTILREKGIESSKRINTMAALLGLVTAGVVPASLKGPFGAMAVTLSGAVVLGVSLVFYSRHKTFQGIVASAGGTLLSFVYLGLMFGAVLALRREHTIWTLLWVLMVIKSSDIGAYFTGKSIGKHKLIVWLSPGKTWEGLLGGMVFAALAGAGGLWLLHKNDAGATALPGPAAGLLAGAMFAVLGQGGDLVMSLFKRDAGIKDSSTLFPGLGGVLDVLDSPLLVTPAAYWWLWLATNAQTSIAR
jgi:phosphatidate cytidylyltransferase